MSKKIFTDMIMPSIVESLEDDKKELCDFINDLDQEEFGQLMDVLSSIMMDPLTIGDEDDASHEIEGDDEIKDVIADGASPEEIAKALDETGMNEKTKVSAGERLKIAKENLKNVTKNYSLIKGTCFFIKN